MAERAAARIPLILERLGRAAKMPAHGRGRNLLDSLIQAVLSQNTTDANSGRAFEQLKARFPTWDGVLHARLQQIAAAIRSGGLAEIKSRRIKQILRRIEEDRGKLDLGFLAKLTRSEARDYLMGLPGVGPKTASVVLLFSLGLPAFPVDTHVLRVSKRLGLLPPKTTMERAHDIYESLLHSHTSARARWDQRTILALHLGLVRHGREICHPRRPHCGICSLHGLCPRIGVGDLPSARRRP